MNKTEFADRMIAYILNYGYVSCPKDIKLENKKMCRKECIACWKRALKEVKDDH